MTDPTVDHLNRETSALSGVRWMLVLVAALSVVGTCIFVWVGSQARNANCDNVRDAFDAYTNGLVVMTDSPPEVEAQFRALYEPYLAECA